MKYYFADTDKRKIKKDIKIIIIRAEKSRKEEEIPKDDNHQKSKNNIKQESISTNSIKKQLECNYLDDGMICQSEQREIEKQNKFNSLINDSIMKIDEDIQKNNDKINPNDIKLFTIITKDSYADYILDNTFALFTSINDIIYLVYSNSKKSIISYNLLDNKKINEIKNAHARDITNFRYFFDKINKRDLMISISLSDNNLKLWNMNNFECLINLENVNKSGRLFSGCMFSENNAIYIITSCAYGNNESIKIFDMNKIKIKEIKDSTESAYFIDIFFDNNLSKNFLVVGNHGFIKSYDYNNNKIYRKYNDNDNNRHCSIIINKKEEVVKLIDSSFDGNIRIWDFHSGQLLNKIKVSNNGWLIGICLWDNENLFVGCGDKSIKLIDLRNRLIKSNLNGFKNKVLCIKKILHPQYGECLISQEYENGAIKLVSRNLYEYNK